MFGPVHGCIGFAHERFHLAAVVRIHGDAQTVLDIYYVAIEKEWLIQG